MKPFFSIIIPTYNRPKQLANCLWSLSNLQYPCDRFEVIVVDDGSTVPLISLVESFQDQLDITLVTQENVGPSAARNAGAAHAKGKFLAFTDDDCMLALDWLEIVASRFREKPDCVIGGRTINLLANNIYSSTSQLIVNVVYRYYNAKPMGSRFFATNNIALPAGLFYDIGGFDPSFTVSEDREFCDRSLYLGIQLAYVSEALVYHAHQLEFLTFCRQHLNYGRGAIRFHQLRKRRGHGGLLRDLGFHLNLRNWLVYPLSQVHTRQMMQIAGLLIVWQIANMAGVFWELISQRLNSGKETS